MTQDQSTTGRRDDTIRRVVALLAGVALLPVLAVMMPAVVSLRLSVSGFAYFMGLLLGCAGLLSFPWRRNSGLAAICAGLLLGCSVATTRLVLDADGLFDGTTNDLIAENDLLVVGATWLPFTGFFADHETDGFAAALVQLSREIQAHDGVLPGRPSGGSTLSYSANGESVGTVVFLHGYGGNTASFCWVIAHAASAAGFDTLCPSCGFDGRWAARPECTHRALDLVTAAAEAGPVVLVGLSNGAVGASQIGGGELHIDGLVLISGIDATAEPSGVPTLVLYGELERRFSLDSITRYAAAAPESVEVAVVDGGHFILVKQRHWVSATLSEWLRATFAPPLP